MFVGHIGVAFAAKRAAPRTSAGTLVAAALFLDLIWPIFLLAGWERVKVVPGNTSFSPLFFEHYPFSHSLLATLGWASLLGAVYWRFARYRRGALVTGALVVSHWLLDATVHRPDLPLYPGSHRYAGLRLWDSVPGTLAVELGLLAVGIGIYASLTRERNRAGSVGFWGFVVFLLALYCASVVGSPPPGAGAVAFAGLASWAFPVWAAWVDARRVLRKPPEAHSAGPGF